MSATYSLDNLKQKLQNSPYKFTHQRKVVLEVLTPSGFWLLLLGGIAYTIGAVLYGIGSKKKWMHSVFHIFVDIGSLLHFLCVLLYAV